MNKFTEDFIRRLENDLEVERIDDRNLEVVGTANTYLLEIMPDGFIHYVEYGEGVQEGYTAHELVILDWIQDAESIWAVA